MARDTHESIISMIDSSTEPNQDAIKTVKETPIPPTEIWLQILEHDDHQHLWSSVRNVSRTYRDLVERLFTSKYLADLSIALSLPRRDAGTGKMKWPGDPIPRSQLEMTYSQINENGRHIRLESPILIEDRHSKRSLEELKVGGTLPKERLEEAPAYVNMSSYSFAGITISVPVQVDWDEARKVWTWDIEWRKLLSSFYDAKEKRRARWPSNPAPVGGQGRMRPRVSQIPGRRAERANQAPSV